MHQQDQRTHFDGERRAALAGASAAIDAVARHIEAGDLAASGGDPVLPGEARLRIETLRAAPARLTDASGKLDRAE